MKRQALGKGLEALLPKEHKQAFLQVDLNQIQPNALQPRLQFESARLEDLAASIKENGILQPIIVRAAPAGYEIIAGERRWRAAQKAGLKQIPAIVQDVSDERMLALALVENIQRDELNPIEEATAYQLLIEEFQLSQLEVARRVGRSRSAITNALRLLRLPRIIQQALLSGELSMGHARALLPLAPKEQLSLARQIATRGWSVRQVEKQVQRAQRHSPYPHPKDPDLWAAEQKLEETWKTRVVIRRRGLGGQIILYFDSEEHLEHLYQLLSSAAP